MKNRGREGRVKGRREGGRDEWRETIETHKGLGWRITELPTIDQSGTGRQAVWRLIRPEYTRTHRHTQAYTHTHRHTHSSKNTI